MRIVIAVFLAANALLFYWITQESDREDVLLAELSTNLPPLQLLSEATPQVTDAPMVAKKPRKPVETIATERQTEAEPPTRAVFLELACYSLGPFDEEASVKSASSTLSELGLVTTYKSETRREISGYWVYIPPLPNRRDARKVTDMLKQRGIKDYLIVSTGSRRNAISLGFFGTRDGAQQHQTRMKALGLNPVLEDSFKEISGFWLDFVSPNTPPLPESVIEALHRQYDEISIKKRPCLK